MKNLLFIGIVASVSVLALFSESRAQGNAFIWVPVGEVGRHPGYSQVVGGKLNDGTVLPVCRTVVNGYKVPGKYYNRGCLVPWNGKELQKGQEIEILMTNGSYRWKEVHSLSKAQIEGAVFAASGQAGSGNLYICRRQLQDGMHPGKYGNGSGVCYIPWGGKELTFTDGFDIMFP